MRLVLSSNNREEGVQVAWEASSSHVLYHLAPFGEKTYPRIDDVDHRFNIPKGVQLYPHTQMSHVGTGGDIAVSYSQLQYAYFDIPFWSKRNVHVHEVGTSSGRGQDFYVVAYIFAGKFSGTPKNYGKWYFPCYRTSAYFALAGSGVIVRTDPLAGVNFSDTEANIARFFDVQAVVRLIIPGQNCDSHPVSIG
ncbi:hypothetical protein FRX31_002043 [Thalictrum thalictroides]|uniref:Uncharacterized protein n=1 Tax=Thalictrum thalictroides TaxID=46969 RepID=A0A7J6XF07_THATH|nr:hypothetical protein FRX31_002043 [Thalictrum thalictroides]